MDDINIYRVWSSDRTRTFLLHFSVADRLRPTRPTTFMHTSRATAFRKSSGRSGRRNWWRIVVEARRPLEWPLSKLRRAEAVGQKATPSETYPSYWQAPISVFSEAEFRQAGSGRARWTTAVRQATLVQATRRNHSKFNLTYIGYDFSKEGKDDFSTGYIRTLFQQGFDKAHRVPPGFTNHRRKPRVDSAIRVRLASIRFNSRWFSEVQS